MTRLAIALAGEEVVLCAEKALYWPRARKLFVADVHFGKAAVFRARGVPVPHGTTSENLARLDRLIAELAPQALVFLGDFLHGREARNADTLAALRAWRAAHPRLALVLVRGNHDAHAGDPPPELALEIVGEPHLEAPFALCHHPGETPAAYTLAGHLHPAWMLRGPTGESLRLPCFWIRPGCAVLPAFGAFTGMLEIERDAGDRVYLIGGERIFAV
jgi:uncharacterized protein